MDTIAALGALTAFYVLLRRDLAELKRDLKGDIARLESRIGGHDARFDQLSDRLDGHVTRLDAKIDLVRGELIAYLGKGTPPAA